MFEPLFEDAEKAYALPLGVLAAMALQESGGDPWAMRYEPAFFSRYIQNADEEHLGGLWPRGVSNATERMARATSFGLLQVMGQVARELEFRGLFLTQLCDPETGIAFGAKHLRRKLDKYGSLEKAISAYNAGSPTPANFENYVRPIMARIT